jgi:hypothetical protein
MQASHIPHSYIHNHIHNCQYCQYHTSSPSVIVQSTTPEINVARARAVLQATQSHDDIQR